MLSVLDLFSREHTTLTAEQIAASIGLTRTTCYRYTRELAHAGLLVSDAGLFMLGPRIIELDHKIIESDPFLNAGRPVVSALAQSLGATGLLTTSYDDRVINVFEHSATLRALPLSFGRGTRMSLFKSSSSKVILAAMSRARLKRLWTQHQHDPECRAIGADWLSFWQALQAIKRQVYWMSVGELDPGLVGISAPIVFEAGDVAGSMTLVFEAHDFQMYDVGLLGARLKGAAAQVSRELAALLREIPAAASCGDARRPPERKPADGAPRKRRSASSAS